MAGDFAHTGRIFINYRRSDSEAWAGRVYDWLEQRFGKAALFMDVDNIPAGLDFVDVLDAMVDDCAVFLALIGPKWLSTLDQSTGQPRLFNHSDYVATEIKAALQRNIRVMPVMLGDAPMPSAEQLPVALQSLARRNAIRLQSSSFARDMQGMIAEIEDALVEVQALREAAEAEAKRREAAKKEHAASQARARQEAERQANIAANLSPKDIARAAELNNWEFVKSRGEVALLRDHLARYSDGDSTPWALAKLEDLEWANLGPSAEMLERFLAEFPESARAREARARLAQVRAAERAAAERTRRRKQSEAFWENIKDTGDKTVLVRFARQFPDSPHADDARRLARALGRGGGSMVVTGSVVGAAGLGFLVLAFSLLLIQSNAPLLQPTKTACSYVAERGQTWASVAGATETSVWDLAQWNSHEFREDTARVLRRQTVQYTCGGTRPRGKCSYIAGHGQAWAEVASTTRTTMEDLRSLNAAVHDADNNRVHAPRGHVILWYTCP